MVSVRCSFCNLPLGTGNLWVDVYCKDCYKDAKKGGGQ